MSLPCYLSLDAMFALVHAMLSFFDALWDVQGCLRCQIVRQRVPLLALEFVDSFLLPG